MKRLFEKGNTFGKGGARIGAGRKSNREKEEMKRKAESAQAIIQKHGEELGQKLIANALSKKGWRSLHLAIDKLVPDAKQVIQLEASGLLEEAIRKVRERRR